jgi:AcrR family transcriptional regulator
MPAPNAVTNESRAERRKRETRERLLTAALDVFLKRGFDAATTAEMAEAADVGAGTFYLHFKDKRDVYEALARHAAREMIDRWRDGIRRGMSFGDVVALGLETAAEFWAQNRERARLLLEGGPSLGSEAHVRLLEDLAEIIRREVRPSAGAELMATMSVGLGIEIGRLVAGGQPESARRTVAAIIDTVRPLRCPPVASRPHPLRR